MEILMERIKALCKARGLSLKDVERGAGITVNTMCRWGESAPSVDKVQKVADFFCVTVDDLLRDPSEAPEQEDTETTDAAV